MQYRVILVGARDLTVIICCTVPLSVNEQHCLTDEGSRISGERSQCWSYVVIGCVRGARYQRHLALTRHSILLATSRER